MRLREINTQEAANAYVPSFVADFNRRFGKPPKSDHDAHRPLREDEVLRSILTVRVLRKVTARLTVQYDHVMYLLQPTPSNQLLVDRYVDVFEFSNGEIEILANGVVLPYKEYDRLPEVDAGAVVENKRLGHALLVAQTMQAQRDNRRIGASPSRTNRGAPVNAKKTMSGLKKQRAITKEDFNDAIEKTSKTWQNPEQIVIKPTAKPRKKAVYNKVKPH